jgi:uncharacterized protein
MPDAPFQRKQRAFAAHIRDPAHCPPPDGIEDRRLAVYRELFFNNLNNLLGKSFPVLRAVLDDEQWRRLVREFMARHRAHTPYFLEIPREFVGFLAEADPAAARDRPFLAELAHYEWAELALSVSTDRDDAAAVDRSGDLLDGVPVKSVLAWPLSYRFPVHRISKRFQPAEAGARPTCLVIYRKPDDDLAFMELNELTAALLERIAGNDRLTGRALLLELGREIAYADTAALLEHGRRAMEEMRDAGILPGVRRRSG